MKWREAGAGDPLILIHGFPFNSTIWNPQLESVPEGWRFIAPDLRGFGDSPLGAGALTMDTFADDVVSLMDAQNVEQAVVCGLSMGGYVALSLVMRHPDRVRALVLVATRAGADNEQAKRTRLEQATRVRAEGVKFVVDTMLPKLFSAHSRMKLPNMVAQVRAIMQATPPETMARALEGMAARKDYTGELSSINVSTLVVRGEQDEIIPAADMESIARSVRGARHEMVALTGHLPNHEAPDVFNTILAQFLKPLPPAFKLGDLSLRF
ncbi:MAG: alpha/beta fold hydrolase [Gemmatimonadota bacterium]